MLQFVGAPGGSLRGADYDQKHSCWSCYPHSLHFCRFGGAPDSSSPRDECICRYALWSLRLRISQEGLRARAARRRVRDSALDGRANVPAVLVSLCASEGPARPSPTLLCSLVMGRGRERFKPALPNSLFCGLTATHSGRLKRRYRRRAGWGHEKGPTAPERRAECMRSQGPLQARLNLKNLQWVGIIDWRS